MQMMLSHDVQFKLFKQKQNRKERIRDLLRFPSNAKAAIRFVDHHFPEEQSAFESTKPSVFHHREHKGVGKDNTIQKLSQSKLKAGIEKNAQKLEQKRKCNEEK